MSLKEKLLYELGVQWQISMVDDTLMVCGDDRVVWTRDRIGGPWQVKSWLGTLVKLASGELVGYTNLQLPQHHQWCRLPKLPRMSSLLGPSQNVPAIVTIQEVVLERKRDHFELSGKREDLEDVREVALFHQPPAVRTTLTAYGHPVWWYLDKDELIAEDEDHGVWYAVPWPNTIDELYRMLQGGYRYGQRGQAAQANHGHPAAEAGQSAGASYYTSARQGGKSWAQAAGASISYQDLLQQTRALMGNPLYYTKLPGHWVTLPWQEYVDTPKQPLPREVRTGEIIAWRGWAISQDRDYVGNVTQPGLLTSIYKCEHVWYPHKTLESKAPNDHDHDDGVHAFKTREQALSYLNSNWNQLILLGKVRLWGEVVECEIGYRAQFAAIESVDEVLNNKQPFTEAAKAGYLWKVPPDAFLEGLRKTYGLADDEHEHP